MICPKCGGEVAAEFRFCGMCGTEMPTPVAEPAAPVNENAPQPASQWDDAAERDGSESSISGPSFLGLGRGTEAAEQYSYLLEPEPRRRHLGVFLLTILVLVAAGVVAVKWAPIRQYAIEQYRARVHKPAATSPPATDRVDNSVASTEKPAAPVVQPGQPQMVVEEPPKPAVPPQTTTNPEPATSLPESKPAPGAEVKDPAKQLSDVGNVEPAAPAKTEAKAPAEISEPARPARSRRLRDAQPKEEPGGRLLMLGEKYLYGRGAARNCTQAVVYLKAAANAGNTPARSHLGALYSTGECVPRDRVLAYHWFTLAKKAEPANPWLESNLNMLWRDMSSAERRRVGAER